MWIFFSILAFVIILAVYYCKTDKTSIYTKQELQNISTKELNDIHEDLGDIIFARSNIGMPPEKKIKSTHGCKTLGEATALMDLIVEVQKDRLQQQKTNTTANFPPLTDTEKDLLSKKGELNNALTALDKAKKGDAEAMLFLGITYDQILNIPNKAFYWMEKSKNKGNVQALYFLGTYYADGYGVNQNKAQGIGLIMNAASKGYEPAIDCCKNKLGMSIQEMRNCGIPV